MQDLSEYMIVSQESLGMSLNESKAIDYIKEYCEKYKILETLKKIYKNTTDWVAKKAVVCGYILYKLITDKNIPVKEKMIAFGAIVYFVSPVDAINDILPGGYTDDIVILEEAIRFLNKHITPELKKEAEDFYKKIRK